MDQQTITTNPITAQEVCDHEIVIETRGQVRFTAGEVDDTLEVYTVCRKCGCEPAENEMQPELALSTVRDYVCSRCYGQLVALSGNGHLLRVECTNHCGGGFVTRQYAEAQKQASAADLIDVLANVGDALGIPKPARRNEAQILKELGF